MNHPPETAKRTLNIMEALIVAALIGLTTLIFSMREAVIKLQVTQENTNATLLALQAQLADVPALSQRVTRLEIRQDATIEIIKELRGVKGLK